MNCNQTETKLIAYLDGKLEAGERGKVEAHLASCEACRVRADEFRRLWTLLDELPVDEPSSAFNAGLRVRLAAEPRPRPLWAWLMPSPRLAFAVMLLVILSAWVSSVPPTKVSPVVTAAGSEEEFKMINNLPVLEDYDVLANFDALSELPAAPVKDDRPIG